MIIKAISDVNIPKLTSSDIPLFRDILSDLFPGKKLVEISFAKLDKGIKAVVEKQNLLLVDNFYEKLIQLYETSRVRHGLMVVGEPLSGKTTIIQTLAEGIE